MRRFVCGVGMALLVGCSSDTGGDVTGPFSGMVYHFRVDDVILPSTSAQQTLYSDDLDGDGGPDNQLGLIVTTLTGTGDTTRHVQDMIRSSALTSFVELQTDSLENDDSAGVTYYDRSTGGTAIGGRLSDGAFESNRTVTTKHFAAATVFLPVFADADPLEVPLVGVEIDLTPGTSNGTIRGGIPIDQARPLAYAGVAQMMRDNPTAHLPFARLVDTNKDGAVSEDELAASALISSLLVDDIAIDGQRVLSVGFGFHVCDVDAGGCELPAPVVPCADRIKDNAETDVDCGGGSCPACPATLACNVPGDCESGACDAGKCRAPTCTDGFRDGFESDVDCGAQCGTCAAGKKCAVGADCASGHCNATTCQ